MLSSVGLSGIDVPLISLWLHQKGPENERLKTLDFQHHATKEKSREH